MIRVKEGGCVEGAGAWAGRKRLGKRTASDSHGRSSLVDKVHVLNEQAEERNARIRLHTVEIIMCVCWGRSGDGGQRSKE